MAKRFTDTGKWDHPDFRRLSPDLKTILYFLNDRCDHAGVWVYDLEALQFYCGVKTTLETIVEELHAHVELLDHQHLYLTNFVRLQYGELRDNNSVHNSVIRLLRAHGLDPVVESGFSTRPSAVAKRLSLKRKLARFAADEYRCTYCGTPGDRLTLTVDHILARSKGGDNDDDNLTTACGLCNSKKGDLPIEEFAAKVDQSKFSDRLLELLNGAVNSLNAPFKELKGAKDKDKDKDKDKELDRETEKTRATPPLPPDLPGPAAVQDARFNRAGVEGMVAVLRFHDLGEQLVRHGPRILAHFREAPVFEQFVCGVLDAADRKKLGGDARRAYVNAAIRRELKGEL